MDDNPNNLLAIKAGLKLYVGYLSDYLKKDEIKIKLEYKNKVKSLVVKNIKEEII